MEGSHISKLRVWQDSPHVVVQDPPAVALPDWAGPHNAGNFADRLYASEALQPSTGPLDAEPGTEPYTLQWFLNIEIQRHRRGRWIPRLLEFAKHSGETLLGLGNGLGTDWLQYARHGAAVVVCSPSSGQLQLIRRNFELRGLGGRFVHAPPEALPLEAASIDVACISGLLGTVADPRQVVDEVYRVLKPGGKVLAVAPARYDVDFWSHVCWPWPGWLQGRRPTSRTTQFSARGLRRLFNRFVEPRIHKRHLSRSEVPHLWRLWPRSILERLMGRVLVLKAFKPLIAANGLQAAA
jgi:ubiquinone/menaquinone biosynthesis C-methylase UbiE